MRHAVIDKETGVVINVVMWDGKAKWSPGPNHYVVAHEDVDIDDIHDAEAQTFTKKDGRVLKVEPR
jgi:hypothetical protein